MAATHLEVNLPGRLGDSSRDLRTDPRTDPRVVALLGPMELDVVAPPLPVGRHDALETRLAVAAAVERDFQTIFAALAAGIPPAVGVETRTETIKGVDGNDITLHIERPADRPGPLPGLLHLHGGGMAILTATDFTPRAYLAAQGCVVVGVEFRNSAGVLGAHPFPAGLNDCATALDWMHSHRDALGLSSIVVTGESGGGNLSLATALKARREGRLDHIDGVYAQVPFIFGGYDTPDPVLPSLIENDGYFLGASVMTLMASLYDPAGEHTRNPLAWPYFATPADLQGLPPHVVTTDELDPLRDEGLAYLRALQRAGVEATGHTLSGVPHAGEWLAAAVLPDLFGRVLRDIADFARSMS
ncbi:MAG: alpha/beta hydrolase fold domain-containing protein [Microbacteriaceae bacterium]